jgi:hypothetical protein
MVVYLGIEIGDTIGHKRFLALFSGGMLPIISLSFLHMLVKFEEENKNQTYLVEEVVSETNIEDKSLIDEYRIANENKFNFLKDLPIEEGIQPKTENKPSDSQDGVRRLSYVRRDA